MIIALGTRSAPKVAALESALAALGWDARIEAISTESGVSDMPTSSQELAQGALNRAANALAAEIGADYGVGIE
jgi:non-canonical (house-cleaning) NTP pyrophosphatase